MSFSRIFIGIIIVALLSLVGFAGYQQFLAPINATPTPATQVAAGEEIVSAQGNLVPLHRADLAFRSAGRVAEIFVIEGQDVQQGDVLMRLQDDDLQVGLAQAHAALDLANANLAQLEEGARDEEIAQVEASLQAAGANLSAAVAERDRLTSGASDAQIAAAQANFAVAQVEQKLAQDAHDRFIDNDFGGTPEEQARFRLNAANQSLLAAQKALDGALSGTTLSLRAAQANVSAASAQRDLVQAQLDQLVNGATASQIAAAQATVAQAEAGVQAALVALGETSLIAPFDGTIAQVAVDVGQVVAPGFTLISIADFNSWQVETDDLSEVDVVSIQVGQPVGIQIDAMPDTIFEGRVASIAPRSETKRGDVTYTIKVDVQGDDPRALWGMTVQVEILVGE